MIDIQIIHTQQIARARTAILLGRVSVESFLASFAVEPFRVVKTLLAFASLLIARARVIEVDVVIADARLAASSGSSRISEVVVRAFVTSGSGVTYFAVASEKISERYLGLDWLCLKILKSLSKYERHS